MKNLKKQEIKILFSQAHKEQLVIAEDAEGEAQFSLLRQTLANQGYAIDCATKALTSNQLAGAQILVLGAPGSDLKQGEIEAIKVFVQDGGGLLLVSSAETMINPPFSLNRQMAAMTGLQFQEYLNYPITFLQVFRPHYITANVGRIRVGKIASLDISNGARPLAFTRATRQTVMACADVERGRVVAIGDVGWLTDEWLAVENNEKLALSTFHWLAARNVIDIERIVIPETVEWGQTAEVVLHLRNSDAEVRPQLECVLESDADAIISEPACKGRSIPPGKTTRMRWTVRPQILGEQELRLVTHIDGQATLFFDQLPGMRCEAPGYLTLQTRNADGESETKFETGDQLIAEGTLHWPTGLEPPPYGLELEYTEGLIERGYQPGEGVSRWHLEAVAPGEHILTLKICQTDQSLPAMITVHLSLADQLAELRAAYICPLDAEIAERLQTVEPSLSDEAVRRQKFQILPPDQYIRAVYDDRAATWLTEVLAAARREQWYNLELLNQVLVYLAPAYLPSRGSFVPYDPALVSSLARLHPAARWRLECNWVRSEESEDINAKQNIAAYLLHEKYGHGFFYTHTRLGQQLAILQHHGFPEKPDDERYQDYVEVAHLIEDSAIIVNEGFAAWMELTFLGRLDHEVRQAVLPRRVLLLQEATDLYERQRNSRFFRAFPPRFDSPYLEGFEYLDFISQHFNLCCAVRLFLIATNVEFGISEDAEGTVHFELGAAEIEGRLLEAEEDDARSHLRFHRIGQLLYDHRIEMQARVRKRYCPEDCTDYCPLEKLIEENLKWRRFHD